MGERFGGVGEDTAVLALRVIHLAFCATPSERVRTPLKAW
jgi:hypothetical protein